MRCQRNSPHFFVIPAFAGMTAPNYSSLVHKKFPHFFKKNLDHLSKSDFVFLLKTYFP